MQLGIFSCKNKISKSLYLGLGWKNDCQLYRYFTASGECTERWMINRNTPLSYKSTGVVLNFTITFIHNTHPFSDFLNALTFKTHPACVSDERPDSNFSLIQTSNVFTQSQASQYHLVHTDSPNLICILSRMKPDDSFVVWTVKNPIVINWI